MSLKFAKNKEDFLCEICGVSVVGNGYTDHCPNCLWSKHVDINPGDRQETCLGLMKPIKIEKQGDKYRVLNRCEKCGKEKINDLAPNDNWDAIIKIQKDFVTNQQR